MGKDETLRFSELERHCELVEPEKVRRVRRSETSDGGEKTGGNDSVNDISPDFEVSFAVSISSNTNEKNPISIFHQCRPGVFVLPVSGAIPQLHSAAAGASTACVRDVTIQLEDPDSHRRRIAVARLARPCKEIGNRALGSIRRSKNEDLQVRFVHFV